MKRILFGALSLLLIVGTSCKKDKNNQTCDLSNASMAGSYKVTGLTTQLGNGGPEDSFDEIEACSKDDIITYRDNNSYSVNDAGTPCDRPSPYTGSWSLNGTTFSIMNTDGTDVATISAFDCNGFTATSTDMEGIV